MEVKHMFQGRINSQVLLQLLKQCVTKSYLTNSFFLPSKIVSLKSNKEG